MDKVKIIIRKEWMEVFKNKMVLFTVIFLPLLLTAIPLVILGVMGEDAGLENMGAEMPEQFNAFCPGELGGGECFQVYMASQFMIMFMIMPLVIPATISSYSIVGEKTTRSLEPLLATPITTGELLVGKGLAAVIPAVLATYGAFAIFGIGSVILIDNRVILGALFDIRWLIAVFVVGPLLALAAVAASVMVSSRVNDPRVAEQVSMIIIVPVLAVFFGQLAGLFLISRALVVISAVVLLAADALLMYIAVQLFQRETILTRWK